MKVNSTQWHARIVHFPYVQVDGYVLPSMECKDFCSYTRWFLFKLLLIIPSVCLFSGSVLGHLVGEVLGIIATGTYIPYNAVLVTSLLTLLGVIIAGVAFGFLWYKGSEGLMEISKKLHESSEPKEPSFFTLWYRKVKDKFCPTITYD